MGKVEETAICVLTPGEVIQQLGNLMQSGPIGKLDQNRIASGRNYTNNL